MSLMLKLRVVMIKMSLLIRRKVRKNLRSTLRTLGTQRKILLLINIVKSDVRVQKPMPFPSKKDKSKEEEICTKFCEWTKPLFLQIPLTDAIKLPPYA